MNIIETRDLTQRYWTKVTWSDFGSAPAWTTAVLHRLTFTVPSGSITALLGANGAGKTTLLKVLVNLLRPSAGEVRVLGVDSVRLGEREFAQMGYVAEGQQQPSWMTVRQFLDYCRPFYPTWDVELEKSLLTRFALPADRRLAQLSRGTLMKAVLLSALAFRPKLLVLDEPFSGLDPVSREDITHGLLESVRQGETTVLVSSHDIEEVERLADRVALLEDGRLRLAEATDALLQRFRRIEVAQDGIWQPEHRPTAWLNCESTTGRTTFIDSAYDPVATESLCRTHFPFAAVRAHPMTLREIFIVLARQRNLQAREEVA